jgi:hypothetical protein
LKAAKTKCFGGFRVFSLTGCLGKDPIDWRSLVVKGLHLRTSLKKRLSYAKETEGLREARSSK